MEKYLRELSTKYWATEKDDKKLTKYMNMQKVDGWKVHQEFLIYLFEKIGNEMLSSDFTKKSAQEKDILQQTYHNMAEVIKFLLNPLAGARRQAKIEQHNRKMSETTERK